MKLTRLVTIILISNISISLFGQEIRGLNYHPGLKRASEEIRFKTTAEKHNVPMPADHIFFDDFTTYGTNIYPQSNNWINNSATITRNYSDSSISYGVVTLDCFDSTGSVYGPIRRTNPSDTLTSRLITGIEQSNLFLAFFIQGGGKVDPPEVQDSLFLQFKTPKGQIWLNAWSSPGYQSNTFEQIIVSINDTLLVDSTFQFRFVNFTSLSPDEVQGKDGALSNADYWHIDYVRIKSASSAAEMEEINDVTLFNPLLPIYEQYTAIPYNHIPYSSSYTREKNTVWLNTVFPSRSESIKIGRSHIYLDADKNDTLEFVGRSGGLQLTYPPVWRIDETDNTKIQYSFSKYPGRIQAKFNVKSYLTIATEDIDQYLWNDTIVREEEYLDFYAYDNGTSTYGFGIAGADAGGAAFATKFQMYHPQNVADTLSGVYIYFNQAADQYTEDMEFQVGVWEDADTAPGDLIYITDESNPFTPDFTGGFNNPTTSLNGFMRIDFDEDVLVTNQFYIGIRQLTTEFLNVGYDISFNSKNRMMYYADNEWQPASKLQGIPNGSLMIRPIFDHYEYPTGIKNRTPLAKNNFKAYPNPFRNTLQLSFAENDINNFTLRILDMMGRTIYSEMVTTTSISLEHLSSGIYILNVYNSQTNESYSQKIFKTE